jgi:2,4-dienoyl-CoA reductase-like NADH-dependent reductase (Old Yellow Enzyme family)
MAHLFSPITIAHTRLANRIVMAPLPSGYAKIDGFIGDPLIDYYIQRARGGTGLIITEPMRVVANHTGYTRAHIGIYDDVFIPYLRQLTTIIHEYGSQVVVMLDAPATIAEVSTERELRRVTEQFILAAWRAYAANFDGIMLSAADGGLLHILTSPLLNHRYDSYGRSLDGRLRMVEDILESVRQWIGRHFLLGFRLVAEEFDVGGITLHDARVIARRAVGAGAHILDVTADTRNNQTQIATFPGWCIPLATNIKRTLPDVPIIGSGQLGEPHLADSIIREGSVDLVMLGKTLRANPEWPSLARSFLI